MENRYSDGATVLAEIASDRSLLVRRRYAKRIQYCPNPAKSEEEDCMYYARELLQNKDVARKLSTISYAQFAKAAKPLWI
ncbi:hypothetical protein [Pontibacter kalidii]|uniref:hypothetical protein n=1 Tax=Pontibacter kalidii TaxID=2592049 RepID=UPI00224F38CA|nr:hypothetical protein [Pontibacter kalidii]